MTFYTWMKRNYADDDTEKGKFYRNVVKPKDSLFKNTRPGGKCGLAMYRYAYGRLMDEQFPEYFEVFEECWNEYFKREINLKCR